ncbi:hypothetical protein DKT77_16480 [Meridianimarinicoccus roseus]|uniref:DUF427 domain-containing protein n=1 Tax=Meridianimarinicoccus roseus TaxID=2072018 RepID=A0A2V2L8J7_9RHOB|nr:DUF427 domain-containing protein [Meridianimarinicoccus roseus]PWR01710.1 hypothetical protein DKT77_16480 [Meridianimarinicoccus roseus]
MTNLPTENVQSYPRPPLLERVPHRLRVVFGGLTVADTLDGWRVCETHHPPSYYIPLGDWLPGSLLACDGGATVCEWKGRAQYHDVHAGGRVAARAAWSYPRPTPGFAPLAGCATVYPRAMDACHVGEIVVTPQPGAFYGGWVTPNLTGRIKGAPGTAHW